MPATKPEIVNAVSFTGTGDTENACAASSFSRSATIARPVRLWRTPRSARYTRASTTSE